MERLRYELLVLPDPGDYLPRQLAIVIDISSRVGWQRHGRVKIPYFALRTRPSSFAVLRPASVDALLLAGGTGALTLAVAASTNFQASEMEKLASQLTLEHIADSWSSNIVDYLHTSCVGIFPHCAVLRTPRDWDNYYGTIRCSTSSTTRSGWDSAMFRAMTASTATGLAPLYRGRPVVVVDTTTGISPTRRPTSAGVAWWMGECHLL